MKLKILITSFVIFALVAFGFLIYFSYKLGYVNAKAEQPKELLTPESVEFLHGYKIDYPEEGMVLDTTYLMQVKDSQNHILNQSIIDKPVIKMMEPDSLYPALIIGTFQAGNLNQTSNLKP